MNMDEKFRATRALSVNLAAPLSDADATVQSMEDASPTKWHLAHTTWFFETFILRDHVPGYRLFHDKFPFLFNSYYEAEGVRHARPMRGMLTRPTLDEILEYRHHVDAAILHAFPVFSPAALTLLELGVHHEQQHQELLLTDILHAFAQNPLRPAYLPAIIKSNMSDMVDLSWIEGGGGMASIGHDGTGFAFDCEGPRHDVFVHPFAMANRTVTNGEWLNFMEDGGYDDPRHWLSDGWAWVKRDAISTPAYWRRDDDDGWMAFGLRGERPLDRNAPVTHISLYEADAYASWSGNRLPTEAEWEYMAAAYDPLIGNQVPGTQMAGADIGGAALEPNISQGGDMPGHDLADPFGNVWEWTGSAFRPYPGFRVAAGAVGEYNGKFMSGQFILKGGSCVTPMGHMRASYRNFFYPYQRWQFTGLRLAHDI